MLLLPWRAAAANRLRPIQIETVKSGTVALAAVERETCPDLSCRRQQAKIQSRGGSKSDLAPPSPLGAQFALCCFLMLMSALFMTMDDVPYPILGTMSTAPAAKRKGSPGQQDDDPQAQDRKRVRSSAPDLPEVRQVNRTLRRIPSRTLIDIQCQSLYFTNLLEL